MSIIVSDKISFIDTLNDALHSSAEYRIVCGNVVYTFPMVNFLAPDHLKRLREREAIIMALISKTITTPEEEFNAKHGIPEEA